MPDQLLYRLRLVSANAVEALKSFLKRRPAFFRGLISTSVCFNGSVAANLHTGTVVVIERDAVYKFYFKFAAFYEVLYRRVISAFGHHWFVDHRGEYLVLRQPRYQVQQWPQSYIEARKLVEPLLCLLPALMDNPIKDEQKHFGLRSKVERLFWEHGMSILAIPASILDIVGTLERKISQSSPLLCHGDLWKQNVMRDESGSRVLIDFDKMILMPPVYDEVYFYLMYQVFEGKVDISDVLYDMGSIRERVVNSLGAKCNRLGAADLSIAVCLFLKTLERNVAYRDLERDLETYKRAFESVLA